MHRAKPTLQQRELDYLEGSRFVFWIQMRITRNRKYFYHSLLTNHEIFKYWIVIIVMNWSCYKIYFLSLRGDTLKAAIKEDRQKGLIPFCLIATLGTTACLAFDNIIELGPVCKTEKVNYSKHLLLKRIINDQVLCNSVSTFLFL